MVYYFGISRQRFALLVLQLGAISIFFFILNYRILELKRSNYSLKISGDHAHLTRFEFTTKLRFFYLVDPPTLASNLNKDRQWCESCGKKLNTNTIELGPTFNVPARDREKKIINGRFKLN